MIVEQVWTGNSSRNFFYMVACPSRVVRGLGERRPFFFLFCFFFALVIKKQ